MLVLITYSWINIETLNISTLFLADTNLKHFNLLQLYSNRPHLYRICIPFASFIRQRGIFLTIFSWLPLNSLNTLTALCLKYFILNRIKISVKHFHTSFHNIRLQTISSCCLQDVQLSYYVQLISRRETLFLWLGKNALPSIGGCSKTGYKLTIILSTAVSALTYHGYYKGAWWTPSGTSL